MTLIDPLLTELSHEAATTRRLLERTPQEHLGWKPHEKSMSLARLATHIAEIPGWISDVLDQDEFVIGATPYTPLTVGSVSEILDKFDRNIANTGHAMRRQTTDRLLATWRLRRGDQVLLEMPRSGVIRTMLLNHLIHHRGQLSVYLRLLNVPLPPIYGPTADELL